MSKSEREQTAESKDNKTKLKKIQSIEFLTVRTMTRYSNISVHVNESSNGSECNCWIVATRGLVFII